MLRSRRTTKNNMQPSPSRIELQNKDASMMTIQSKHRPSSAKPIFSLAAMLALLFSVGASALAQQHTNATPKNSAVNVKVSQPVRRPLKRTVKLPGTMLAYEQVDLFAKVSGYVESVNVDIGEAVAKGDPLVVLSVPEMADELRRAQSLIEAKKAQGRAADAQAAQAKQDIQIAKAKVDRFLAEQRLAQVNLKRKTELREAGAIPEQALDEAQVAAEIASAQLTIAQALVAGAISTHASKQADCEVARADTLVAQSELAKLRTLMEYATIRAPFDGVITVRSVDPGAFVRSAAKGFATSLLTMANVNRLRLVVDVPEVDVPFVRAGTSLQFLARALGDAEQSTSVTRVSSSLDSTTRTMRIEADLDNAKGQLTPGMYAQVTVVLELKASAMLVPARAIRSIDGQSSVLVAVSGTAQAKVIRVGYDDGIWSEVLEGLDGDEQVIVTTGGRVLAGTPVRVVTN